MTGGRGGRASERRRAKGGRRGAGQGGGRASKRRHGRSRQETAAGRGEGKARCVSWRCSASATRTRPQLLPGGRAPCLVERTRGKHAPVVACAREPPGVGGMLAPGVVGSPWYEWDARSEGVWLPLGVAPALPEPLELPCSRCEAAPAGEGCAVDPFLAGERKSNGLRWSEALGVVWSGALPPPPKNLSTPAMGREQRAGEGSGGA